MRKRAVVVGLNEYATQTGLRGCVNDGTNLGLALERFAGFASDQVRVISDEAASKRDIEEHLAWLVSGATAGDLLVFHFSGHGSQAPDTGEPDEPVDHLDEILCPYDMAWDGTFITDDYLRERLVVPAGVALEVILDACHTGDSTAEFGAVATTSGANPDRQPRYLPPPVDIADRSSEAEAPTTRLFRSPTATRLALWSACGAAQTADDARIGGLFNGAFTFYLCKHPREAEGNLSRRELLARVRQSLTKAGHAQIPELAAPAELAAAKPFHV